MIIQRMSTPTGSGSSGKPPEKEKKGLFDNIEYKHTARVSRDAWFMRLWAWAWETDVENADFCKLFWGISLLPLNLFLRVVLIPFVLIGIGVKRVKAWGEHRAANKPGPTKEEIQRKKDKAVVSAAKKERREARISKFFTTVSQVADRGVGLAQKCWPVVKVIVYGVGGILALAVAALLGIGVYALVQSIIENASSVGHVVLIVGIIVGVVAVATAIVLGIVYFLAETRAGEAVIRFFDRVFGAFFRAMFIGLCGVKSRTCPKIELIEETD